MPEIVIRENMSFVMSLELKKKVMLDRINLKIKYCVFLILSFVISQSLIAQVAEEDPRDESNAQLARELANPNATLGQMLFPIDYIRYKGDLPDASQGGLVLNFQPSLPVPLAEGLNLYVRPLIPIYLSQPVIGDEGFTKEGGLGNISADVAVGKTWPAKWITLVGVVGGCPTATNKA